MTHCLLSVSKSYEQNFSSREFRGIFELKKSALRITQQKKLHQRVLTECFEQHFEKRHGFIWLLKNLLALSHLF